MAKAETIMKLFMILKDRYPAYFKVKGDVDDLLKLWAGEFKYTPDEDLELAVRLHIKNVNFFPSTRDIADKLRRVDMIRDMNLATYKGRLKTYKEYRDSTPDQVDEWVDTMRVIHPDEAFTTKTFKDYLENSKKQVSEAWDELTDQQKEGVEPWAP